MRVVVVGNGFVVFAEHHVCESAVGVGGREAVARGDGIAIGADGFVVVAKFSVGETFPQVAARIVEGDVGSLLEVGDGHFLFVEVVEADAAAEVGIAQLGIGFDRLREGANGIGIVAEHAFGDATAVEGSGTDLSMGGILFVELL